LALKLWGDFGFCAILIGIGYAVVAVDRTNRALVRLGIPAKGFDIVVLTSRWISGITKPFVLIPAAIDGVFPLLRKPSPDGFWVLVKQAGGRSRRKAPKSSDRKDLGGGKQWISK
jgi:hypothetical protein